VKKTRSDPAPSVPESIARLCDQLADSVYVMDDAGVIRYANQAFEEMTGYRAEEAVGRSATMLASGAHPDAVYEEMWGSLRAGRPYRFVFTNRKKDGSTYGEGVMVSPIADPETGGRFYLHLGRLIRVTRQSYDLFTILADSAPAGIYLEREGTLYFVNHRLASMLGRPAEELVGAQWPQLVLEADRARAVAYGAALRDGTVDQPLEIRIPNPAGDQRWVMASVQPIVLSGPQAVAGEFNAGYVVDITGRKLAEERLRNAISLHAATIESATDGIVVIDNARRIVSHNQRFAEIWKLNNPQLADPDDVRKAMAAQIADPEAYAAALRRTRDDPSLQEMIPVELLDGRQMEVYCRPQIVDGKVAGRVWSWRDVTERRRFEAALLQLANYDSLTGLMNRRKIQEELEACLADHGRARGALLLLDLDGFKEVNDTFGHQAGDEVLVQVARILSDSDLGELIARFGGDEFAVLLPGVSPSQAMQTAERILHHISEHDYLAAGGRVSLTGSMGVALYPVHATTSDELLSAADLALYEAKSDERNSLRVYSPRLKNQSRLQQLGDLQTQLRDAISRSQGRLYAEKTQPLRGDQPLIYRLTIRMTGSRNQVLSSRDITALAQRASLSAALDRWLLREAIALARRPSFISSAAGLCFELSVHSLAHPDVLRRLLDLAALRAAHDSPLVLELTALDALPAAESAIATLRAHGYRFEAMEAGSRELAQTLAVMPIDYLKLDASVVRDLGNEPSLRPLVEGAISTARGLGAFVVAEDVQDEAALAVLQELGVDHARGPAVAAARSANTVFRAVSRPRAA
jgi:diguanylate cyclase (GGDEF)-like protein/PAS domain S-box-containing protein